MRIINYNEAVAMRPSLPHSDVRLGITQAALDDIEESIGEHPPEAGGLMFGPRDGGVDTFEFDFHGSREASRTMYEPHTLWANALMDYWAFRTDDDQRVLAGCVHSHPFGPFLSAKAGYARGDLGFAEAILEANVWLMDLHLPVVIRGRSGVEFWSYVVSREHPDIAQFCSVDVCEPASAQPRRWPNASSTAIAKVQAQPTAPVWPAVAFDLDEVAARSRCRYSRWNDAVAFEQLGTVIFVTLPPKFPRSAPSLALTPPEASSQVPLYLRWTERSSVRPEVRLARVLHRAFAMIGKEF